MENKLEYTTSMMIHSCPLSVDFNEWLKKIIKINVSVRKLKLALIKYNAEL